MTANRAFKQAVRARMATTHETYQEARQALLASRGNAPRSSTTTGVSAAQLPDFEAIPGYGRTRGDESTARQVWRDVADIAGRTPKLSLVLGAAVASLYVSALQGDRARSFWVHLAGRSAAGKTTALRAAAALCGDPGDVIGSGYSTTMRGLVNHLGALRCLPAFVYEPGIGMAPPPHRAALVLRVTEGAQWSASTRTGAITTTGPWYGTMLSEGGDSLLDGIANEAVYARLIEIPAPVTLSAADAEALAELATRAYGWPLQWLSADVDLPRIRHVRAEAERAIGLPDGGVLRVATQNLALAVAGAAELDHHLGTGTLQSAALVAASAARGQIGANLTTPGELLMQAITKRARSGRFPAISSVTLEPIEGAVLDGSDPSAAGSIAIVAAVLPALAADAGVADVSSALRQLHQEDVLVSSNEEVGKLWRRIRIGGRPTRVYVFRAPL